LRERFHAPHQIGGSFFHILGRRQFTPGLLHGEIGFADGKQAMFLAASREAWRARTTCRAASGARMASLRAKIAEGPAPP